MPGDTPSQPKSSKEEWFISLPVWKRVWVLFVAIAIAPITIYIMAVDLGIEGIYEKVKEKR